MIDFKSARVQDPTWWRRCRVLLREVAADDEQRLREAIHRHHLALVGNSGLTDESFEKTQKAASESARRIAQGLRPWEDLSEEATRRKQVDSGREAYKAAFGYYPDDPEFLEREQKELDRIRAEREEAIANFTETDYERVNRLRAEQREKIQKLRDRQRS